MNLPNNISVFRIFLVPVFVTLLVYYSPERSYLREISVAVFLVACLTDAVDGYLARKLNQITPIGTYIDPIADKLLLLSGFLSLSFIRNLPESMHIPAWVTIPVIARDVVILIGSTMIFITTGNLKAEPLLIGKATTLMQMLTVLICLVPAPPSFQLPAFFATVLLTVISGIQYIRVGGRLVQSS